MTKIRLGFGLLFTTLVLGGLLFTTLVLGEIASASEATKVYDCVFDQSGIENANQSPIAFKAAVLLDAETDQYWLATTMQLNTVELLQEGHSGVTFYERGRGGVNYRMLTIRHGGASVLMRVGANITHGGVATESYIGHCEG